MSPRPTVHRPTAHRPTAELGPAVRNWLSSRTESPRLLGFSEPMHGEPAFPRLRNELFAELVEHQGYRTIALESSYLSGRLVDSYVREAEVVDEDTVMRDGFSHEFGDIAENRELVRWMRRANRRRPPDEQLRFVGFDAPTEITGAPSPRSALARTYAYLRDGLGAAALPRSWSAVDELLGDDDRWADPHAMTDAGRSVGGSVDALTLRAVADDLSWTLRARGPELVRLGSREAHRDAELTARMGSGLLAYHAAMASAGPERLTRLVALRDAMMADVLDAVAAAADTDGPALVFGHHQHLRRGTAGTDFGDDRLRWPAAGSLLGASLGPDYAVIAAALGTAPHLGVPAPEPGTFEGALAARGSGSRFVPAPEAPGPVVGMRSSEHPAYFPVDDALPGEVDAFWFVDRLES